MFETLSTEFNKNPQMWTFLVTSLLALFYAALKIKNEPNDYLKKSSTVAFQGLELRIPSWWTKTINEEHLIRFERTDTRYDWYAEYYSLRDASKRDNRIIKRPSI